MNDMNDAGAALYIFAIVAMIIFVIIGAQKIINRLKKADEKKKNDKDDDNSHWNIPPNIGIH